MSIKSFVCFKETNSVFALYVTDMGDMSWGTTASRPHPRSLSKLLRRQIAAPTKEINGEHKKTELRQSAAVPLVV